jgi:Flp pilus assembly protein TadB
MFTSGAKEPSQPSVRTSFTIIVSGIAVGHEMRAARHAQRATYTHTAFSAFQPTYIRALCRSRGFWAG